MKPIKFNRYWFKPRRFGLGATPTTWEGWLVVLVFIIWIAYVSIKITSESNIFMPLMAISIVLLISISRKKTNGLWKWRWG